MILLDKNDIFSDYIYYRDITLLKRSFLSSIFSHLRSKMKFINSLTIDRQIIGDLPEARLSHLKRFS